MGSCVLIPADKLEASYSKSRGLVLYAEGKVQEHTHGINFVRVPWIGALKIELEGWTGLPSPKDRDYTHEQAFDIQLPNRAYPSNTVTIVTANHPEGEVLQINWLDAKYQPAKNDVTSKELAPSEPQLLSANDVQLNELLKAPFTIKHAAEVPKGGSIQIKFDPTYLTLTGSGIQDADIYWTFNSLQTGKTQVIVSLYGGIDKFFIQTFYSVRIFLPSAAAPSSRAPRALIAAPATAANDDDETFCFFGRVNIAVRLVQEEYPDAQLYSVKATTNLHGPVNSSNELEHLEVVFNAYKNGKQGTVTIESVGWGEFGPPRFLPTPILGDAVIPWPPKGLIGLTEAVAILRKEGHRQPYLSVYLSQALYPKSEPYYTFLFEDGSSVLVGAKDGKIVVGDGE
ncbi:hypothetical protein MMC22_001848 [Lobaria immixta]|nr:hypothetical protein [Lobaria immixta]